MDLKNWIPIFLINIDVKIASKALALKVRSVMDELVHSDQTAYLKNCYVGESICIVDDILEYTECNQVPGILFSADFEKAFSSIDHTFILVVLEKYGFGPDFINAVKTLFTGAESCVINNGHSTVYSHLKEELDKEIQSLHICSSLLWKFCSLGFVRRQIVQIKFIFISDHELKGSAYADDAKFWVSDIQSLTIFRPCFFYHLKVQGGPPPLMISGTITASPMKLCRVIVLLKAYQNTKRNFQKYDL